MLIKENILTHRWPKLLILGAALVAILAFWFLRLWQKPIQLEPAGNFFTEATSFQASSFSFGKIHYTIDGSLPSAESPQFDDQVTITESTTLRMAVFFGKQQVSKEQVHDVFIDAKHTLPIVNLALRSDQVVDHYGNFISSKNEHLLGQMKYYDPDQQLKFTHNIKLEIHGESLNAAPQKSFRLTLVDESGNVQGATYPFFGPEAPTYFTSLILRNDEAKFTHLREQVANQIVAEATNLDIQRGKPVVLYLNGQYWGLYFLRERFDETYFAQKYGLKAEALGMLEVPLGAKIKGSFAPTSKKSKESAEKINKLLNNVARCNRCVSYSEANTILDMENFLDYLLLEFYFANFDWPYNNYKVWRYQSEKLYLIESEFVEQLDGRFRWLFFDSDVSFGAGRSPSQEMEAAADGDPYAQLIDNHFPFRNLIYGKTFIRNYLKRMEELLAKQLDPKYTDALVDHWAAQIRPEMPAEIARWQQFNTAEKKFALNSMEEWEEHVEMLKTYLRVRPESFRKHTQAFVQGVEEM